VVDSGEFIVKLLVTFYFLPCLKILFFNQGHHNLLVLQPIIVISLDRDLSSSLELLHLVPLHFVVLAQNVTRLLNFLLDRLFGYIILLILRLNAKVINPLHLLIKLLVIILALPDPIIIDCLFIGNGNLFS